MKTLVIFPPQWLPYNPHLAPVAINSMLRGKGHDTTLIDLNIEFYNTILTSDFISKSIRDAFSNYNNNARHVFDQFRPGSKIADYHPSFQRQYQRYKHILKIYQDKKAPVIIENIDKAIEVIKSRRDFYNLGLLDRAFATTRDASDILSSVYFPSRINFPDVVASSFYGMDRMIEECTDIEGNIFYQFFEPRIAGILESKPDYIGISLGDYTQLIPGLTLAMLLKKNGQAHVNIGGNLFGRYTDTIVNEPEFFDIFADSIICNEGEKPVIELLRYLAGEIDVGDVPNLIHKPDGRIVVNESKDPYGINDLPPADFADLPVDEGNYFMPEVIYNIQASRDCYWRKCSFCTHFFGSRYSVKKVERAIDEVKKIQGQQKEAHYFHFIDEAMSPAYLDRLAQRILDENIFIEFYIYARLENEFTGPILKKAARAGLRLILWGFESANERVYTLMNKGKTTGKHERRDILQRTYDAGIWNYLFIMFGFPSETWEEAAETANFLYENRRICSYSKGGQFVLLDKAAILQDPPKYSITRMQKIRSGFSYAYRYETSQGMNAREINDFMKTRDNILHIEHYKYAHSWTREKLFLYLCKYGIEKISAMRDDVWI